MNSETISTLLGQHYFVTLLAQLGHWNMAGVRFSELHELLGDLYEDFTDKIDGVIEQMLSHEDVEVTLDDQDALENAGTPEECATSVFHQIAVYVDFLYDVLENEENLSPEDEDTVLNLLHFVDLWRWKLQRNLE